MDQFPTIEVAFLQHLIVMAPAWRENFFGQFSPNLRSPLQNANFINIVVAASLIFADLSGTGDSQRGSRESIRENHSQLKPLFL